MKQLDIIYEGVTFHFEEMEDGGYLAQAQELPSALSSGETLDEAFANICEAFELAVEASLDWGLPLPEALRNRGLCTEPLALSS